MNSFSFTSEEDHHERHCLDQEIGLDQLGSWRDNSHERPSQEAQLDAISEFDISSQKKQSQLSRSFCKQNNEPPLASQSPAIPHKDQKFISQATAEEQLEQRQEQPSVEQEAATFFQQSNASETVVRERSVINEKWNNQSVVSEFVYMNQHVYNALLNNYRAILDKTKSYSDKSVANLDMYCLFLRIKLEQEQKRCQSIQNGRSKLTRMFQNNLLLQEVYFNEKTVVSQITKTLNVQADRLVSYCQPLHQVSNKIKNLLSTTLQSRKRYLQEIEGHFATIAEIKKQIIKIATHPLQSTNQTDSWFSREDTRSDRYLQRRYLVQRQQTFLGLLQNIGEKIVALLIRVFVQEQPIIHATITQQIAKYWRISHQYYGKNQKQSQITSKKIENYDLHTEIFQIIREIIPKQWCGDEQIEKQGMHRAEQLILELSDYLQDQIFLSSIQIDATHILFKAQAKWITKDQRNQQESAKNNQANVLSINGRQKPITQKCQSPKGQGSPKPASGMTVGVILTIDRYLHMQCGQKIASLKLKKLKLSRKGRAIQVSERNHSIANLFTSPIIFGELIFTRQQDAQKFIGVVLTVK